MIVDLLKVEKKRFESVDYKLYDIISYGEKNDYPQSVVDVIRASYTGKGCMDNYRKFIFGKGFADQTIYQMIVNSDGDTMDTILDGVSNDLAMFGGFSLHLNFNLLGQVTEMRHIPFENVRFCQEEGEHRNQIALYNDWGLRKTKLRKIDADEIEYIDAFGEFDFKTRIAQCGGIQNYKGQIFYYSNLGRWNYPLPKFDTVLTDMNTEEAISNITNRNAKNGFLPVTFIIDILSGDQDTEQESATLEVIRSMTGDKNASKIGYFGVNSKEEIPEFKKVDIANYDKEFDVSRQAVKESIGQAFNQPPILRSEDVGAGFGAEIMEQAYNYYNSVTANERLLIERELGRVLKLWHLPIEINTQIEPLSYGDKPLHQRLEGQRTEVIDVIQGTLPTEKKKAVLTIIYGMTEDEANALL